MAILTLRLVKGVPLTNAEVDGNFSNLNISKVEIGRDLSGNISYPVVSGIQGRDVSSTAPSDAQVLKWSTSGNAWAPASISYDTLNNPPVANIILTGDVTGSANAVLTANSTIITISATTIQANSVALGTDTTGDYVANVLAGTGIVLSGQGGETATPTVSLDASGVTANTYGGSSKVPVLTIDQYGRVTSAANVNVAGVTSFAASGNSFTISTADGGSFTANIQQDSVRLGTDTTGNYVSTVTVGSGLTVSGTADEGNVVTLAHADTSSTANVSSDNSDGTVIQDVSLGFDTFGHVTSASVATVNLDNRFVRLSTGTLQTVTGPMSFEGNVTFTGNVTTVAANNLVITDNFIYLNSANTEINVDIGFAGNYNDGTYQHAGFFRDASDNGTWKIFEHYLPEPSAMVDIDTANASFKLANLAVNKLTANDIISGNILPSANLTYNLGSPSLRFKDLYLSGTTINLGAAVLSATADSVSISAIDNTPIGETTRSTGKFTNLAANVLTANVFSGIINTSVGSCNFFAGKCTGDSTTSGSYNNFAGFCAGFSNTSGCDNNFLGRNAGLCNTTGLDNNFLGRNAGQCNTEGSYNNFFGQCAGRNNTTGSYNTFIGYRTGRNNTLGSDNFFVGRRAGFCNTTGCNNIFIGADAGSYNTFSCYNVFLGYEAGKCSSSTGSERNIFIGYRSGQNSASYGKYNVFLGNCAGACNVSGSYNIFLGSQAGLRNNGENNVFIGTIAGCSNTGGYKNTFLGRGSGEYNTNGCCNTFVGAGAGYQTSDGSQNSFFGTESGLCHTNGIRNTFIGYRAGGNISTGSDNLILGCLSSCVGLTADTSNIIILATAGTERLKVDTGNLSVEAGAGNIVASQGFFNNLVVKNVSEYVANTATFSTTTESTLFEFSKNVYSSGKFTITGKQGSNVQISEMLVAQDGTTAAATEYGVVKTSNVTVFTGNVDISGNNVRVRVIGDSAISTKYTLAGTLLDL